MDLMKVNKIMKEDTGVDYLNFSPANHYDPNSSPSQSILSKRNQTPDSPATLNGSAKVENLPIIINLCISHFHYIFIAKTRKF